MTKKTKILALSLAVLMIAAMFAGCSGSNTAETTAGTTAGTTAPAETTTQAPKDMEGYEFILTGAGNFSPVDSEGKAKDTALAQELRDLYADIESTYNCTITFSNQDSSYDILLASATSGTKFSDFVRIRQSTWIPLAVNHALRPLDGDEMVAAGLDVNDSDCFAQQYTHLTDFTVDGVEHTWGVDMSGKYDRMAFGHTYAFNKKIVADAGYSADAMYQMVYKYEWTYDKMIEIATKCTKDTDGNGMPDIWGVALDTDGNEIWTNGSGPIIYDSATKTYKANCLDSKVITSLEFMASLNQNGKLSPPFKGDGATTSRGERRTLFYTGKAAFAGLYGPQFGDDGAPNGTANMSDPAGLLPIPKGPDVDHYTMNFVDVDLYCMLVSTTEWEKSAYIMARIADGLHDDGEYQEYLLNDSLLGDEDAYKVLTEYLLTNGLMNIAKCSDNMYEITRKQFYQSVYEGTMTPAAAAETYQPLIQAELDSVFHQK